MDSNFPLDPILIRAALDGLQLQLDNIRAALLSLAAMLDARHSIVTTPTAVEPAVEQRAHRPHRMSEEGRRRISEAQLRRWHNYRKTPQ